MHPLLDQLDLVLNYFNDLHGLCYQWTCEQTLMQLKQTLNTPPPSQHILLAVLLVEGTCIAVIQASSRVDVGPSLPKDGTHWPARQFAYY